MHDFSLRHLSDAAVSQELAAATSADRRAVAAHLARIAEFDRRRLYLEHGCASMYRYCVERLRLSEDAAVQRIRAARTALAFPAIFAAVADGRLNLSTVVLVSGRLTKANAAGLLAAVEHRTSKQVRRLLAERFGWPGMPGWAPAPRPEPAGVPGAAAPATDLPVLKRVLDPSPLANPAGGTPPDPEPMRAEPVVSASPRRARLTPVGPGVSELVALLGEEACAQLEASRELLGHAVPSGDLAEVLERAIALQYEHLRRRRCGAANRPRASASAGGATTRPRASAIADAAAQRPSANPRHIPAAVRRAVWERDGGRCAFVSADGHRCGERSRLELDHVVPVARGGRAEPGNLRLLCRAHNQHAAEREFGPGHVRDRREAARRRRAEERLRRQAERERAERRTREIARQREELGEAFRLLGYRGADLERALAYCASRADAPPEARLRYALGNLAPKARKESPVAAVAA